jgi:hypothetical protein
MFGDLMNIASNGFHILIAIYIVLGWLISPVIHGPVCAAIIVHWLLNKNRCIMSEGFDDSNGFSTGLLARVGIDIRNNQTLKTIIPYLLVIIPGIISVVLAIKGIEIMPQIIHSIMSHLMMVAPFAFVAKKIVGAGYKGIVEGLAAADAGAAATPAGAVATPPITAEESAA